MRTFERKSDVCTHTIIIHGSGGRAHAKYVWLLQVSEASRRLVKKVHGVIFPPSFESLLTSSAFSLTPTVGVKIRSTLVCMENET